MDAARSRRRSALLALAGLALLAGCVTGARVVTPLHEAARDGNYDAALRQIEGGGARLDAQDEEGRTALHYTATNGEGEIAGLLLSRGASIDIQDDAGETPLHLAVRNGYAAIAELLLDSGADSGILNLDGQTAADIARDLNLQDMLELIAGYSP
jgi:ankyrin repeat protein